MSTTSAVLHRQRGHERCGRGTFPFAVVMKGNGTAYVSSDRDREVVVLDVASPTAGHLIKARQARRQRARDDARRLAVRTSMSLRTTQTRSPSSIRRRTQSRARLSPRASRGHSQRQIHRRGDVRRHHLSRRQHALRREQRSQLDCGDPARGREGEQCHRVDPHGVRTARCHVQRRRLVDVHHQRQERHRPNPGHLAGATASITSFTYPGGNAAAAVASRASNQYQFQLERASLISAPVPSAKDLRELTERVAQNTGTQPIQREGHPRRRVSAPAYPACHLRRQGKPHVRSDPWRPVERRERRLPSDAIRAGAHAELSPSRHELRHAGTTSCTRRRQHGRLVVVDAGPRDEYRDHHAADQLRVREPRALV